MKYKLFVVSTFFVIVLLVFFVYNYNSSNKCDSMSYLSYTTTHFSNENELEAIIYSFDLQTKKRLEIYRFPVSAMYALGVYDRSSNSVFYVKESDNNTFERRHTGDQIYRYDLTNGTDTQLTDDLLAVNHIFPTDRYVFFLAATMKNPNSLIVGRIDLSNDTVRYWDEPDTSSSRILSIDRENERLYVAIYDTKEEEEAFYSDTGIVPTNTVYSYDYNLEDKRQICLL